MCLKDADRMEISVGTDQTAALEQSNTGLNCLPRPLQKLLIIIEVWF